MDLKQHNQIMNTKTARMEFRTTTEQKALIKEYCSSIRKDSSEFILTTVLNEINRNPLEKEIINSMNESALYNFLQAHAAQKPSIQKLLKEFNEGRINHE